MSDDGTQTFTCKIPKYYINPLTNEKVINPRWETVENGILAENVRILKVFVKKSDEQVNVYPFIIDKITDSRDSHFSIYKSVEASGLAFAELGKVGYKIELDQALVEREMEAAANKTEDEIEAEDDTVLIEPTIDYWLKKVFPAKYDDEGNVIKWLTPWCYEIRMDWRYYADKRESDKIYDDSYCEDWTISGAGDKAELIPNGYKAATEKARIVTCKNSNKYNITQSIAETFEVFCRYEYKCDERGRFIGEYTEKIDDNTTKVWTGRKVIFYNRAIKTEHPLVVDYQKNLDSMSRTSDSTDIFTKLYVSQIDAPSMADGKVSIANTNANPLMEDFILNFDYLDSVGALTNYQKEFINTYKTEIARINREMIPVQSDEEIYQVQKNELEGEKAYHDNAKATAETQLEEYTNYYNNLENQGSVTKDATNAYQGIFVPYAKDSLWYYFSLGLQGVDKNTIKIHPESYSKPSYELSGYFKSEGDLDSLVIDDAQATKLLYALVDENGYPEKIFTKSIQVQNEAGKNEETNIFLKTNIIYASFTYTPSNKYKDLRDGYASLVASETAQSEALQAEIEQVTASYDECVTKRQGFEAEKEALHQKLETILGPALREGYWTPDSYEEYGKAKKYLTDKQAGPVKRGNYDPIGNEYKSYYTVSAIGGTPTYIQYPYINISNLSDVLDYAAPHEVTWYALRPYQACSDREYSEGWYSFQATNSTVYYVYLKNNYTKDTYFSFDADEYGLPRFGIKEPGDTDWKYKPTSGDWSWTTSEPQGKEVKEFSLFKDQILFDVFYYNSSFNYALIEDGDNTSGESALSVLIHKPKDKVTIDNIDEDNGASLVWMYQLGSTGKTVAIDKSNTPVSFYKEIDSATNKAKYPRIKIDELNVQHGSSTFVINNQRTEYTLKVYDDYFITVSGGRPLVTLRPNKENILNDILTGSYEFNYNVSQANEILYLDAVDVAYDNSIPRYTYELQVANLPHEFLDIELGSMLYINDHALGVHAATGYVSDIEMALDAPQTDSISIQNYKTKFEDLFSTIVAQSEAMKTNRIAYDIAAQAFTTEGSVGTLSADTLSNALSANNAYWLNWSACGVEITANQGIILTNKQPYSNGVYGQVVLQGGGVFLSNSTDASGNRVWSAAITPEGINASLIKAGQLNTEKIMIYAGNNTAFMWDAEGIFAYKREEDTPSLKEYVKFSQYGVQVVDDKLTGWDSSNLTNGHNAIVSLNWNGLTLRNNKGEKTLEIDRGDEGGGTLKIMGTMQSERFASGILGYGWRILNNGTAEFQDVHVRGTISSSVFEYKETTAVGGEFYVGPTLIVDYNRAKDATFSFDKNSNSLHLQVDLGLPGNKNLCGRTWQEGDVLGINCCLVNAAGTKYEIKNLRMKLISIGGAADNDELISSSLWDTSLNVFYDENEKPVKLSDVDFNGLKVSGPINCIFIGSESDDAHNRKGILLTAMADNSPYMDIYDDANSDIKGAPKVRLGNLEGLGTLEWDDYSMTPQGYGLYSDNVYLTGAIYATSGRIGSLSIDEIEKSAGQLSLTLKSKIGFVYTETTHTKDLDCEVYCGNTRITKKSDLPAIYQKEGLTFTFGYYSRQDASKEWVAFGSPWNSVPLFDANGNINSLLYTTTNKPTQEYMARLTLSEEIADQQNIQSSIATFQYAANGEKGDKGDSIKGDKGDNAVAYDIIPSVTAISRDLVVSLSPTTLEYSVARYDGGVQTTVTNLSNAGMSIKIKNITSSVESQVIETTTTLTYSLENYAAGKTYGTVDSIKLELYQGSQLLTLITVPFTLGDDLRELGKIQNGQVVINDGKVYTGSIVAGAVTAGKIQTGAITAGALSNVGMLRLFASQPSLNYPLIDDSKYWDNGNFNSDDYNNDVAAISNQGWESATSGIEISDSGLILKGGKLDINTDNLTLTSSGQFKLTNSSASGFTEGYVFGISTKPTDHYALWLGPKKDNNGEDLPYNSTENIKNNALFRVTKQGKIAATAGTIGGWTIDKNGIISTSMPENVYFKGAWEDINENNDEQGYPTVLSVGNGNFTVDSNGNITAKTITMEDAIITNGDYLGANVRVSDQMPSTPPESGKPGQYIWLKPVDSGAAKVLNKVEYSTTVGQTSWKDYRYWLGNSNLASVELKPITDISQQDTEADYKHTLTIPIYIGKNTTSSGNPVGGVVKAKVTNQNGTTINFTSSLIVASSTYCYRDVDVVMTSNEKVWLGNSSKITIDMNASNSSGYYSNNLLNSSTSNKTIKLTCEQYK